MSKTGATPESRAYAKALDDVAERLAECEHLRESHERLLFHADPPPSLGVHRSRILASQRLMSAAFKAHFDAERAKESAWFRLIESERAAEEAVKELQPHPTKPGVWVAPEAGVYKFPPLSAGELRK